MRFTTAWIAAICLVLAGCSGADDGERSAGPHSDEEGKVTYWRVTGSSSSAEGCTDAGDWSSVTDPIAFGANTFLMYMVDAGGATATGQSCDTTDASSCEDSDSAWDVTGNTLVYEPAAQSLPGDASCGYEMNVVWAVVDAGATATLTVDISFSLVPDDGSCDYFEEAVIAAGSNGLGLTTCALQTAVSMDFEKAEAP